MSCHKEELYELSLDSYSINMKAVCERVQQELPQIKEIRFDDHSNIDGFIPLYYFSLAFNGETWYEKHFQARQRDTSKHTRYRTKIHEILHFTALKTSISFVAFLEMIHPSSIIAEELHPFYIRSSTFGEFFQSIPKEQRCRLVGDWISTFMIQHLKGIFHNTDWVIDLPLSTVGGKLKSRKYYCPKRQIRHTRAFRDFGIDPTDI